MLSDQSLKMMAKHLRHYAVVLHAEAEKLEIIGVRADPDLFAVSEEVHELAEMLGVERALQITAA